MALLIQPVTLDVQAIQAATHLLTCFCQEENFPLSRRAIEDHLTLLIQTPGHWAALAYSNEAPVGVMTLSSSVSIEFGRFTEIGDLYVLPHMRGQGIAKTLLQAGYDWCLQQQCLHIGLVVTPEGEARHQLSAFYQRLGFTFLERKMAVKALARPA